MSELPCGWTVTTLGEVANWGSGGTPSRSESKFYGGTIPWIKSGELNSRYVTTAEEHITEAALNGSSAKLFRAGSVAIAMYGATIGKTAILGIDAATNQACAVGVPIEGLTEKEFLYRLLQNEKDSFIEKGKGGAQPNISQAVIKAHTIGLPPLAEQIRITQKLDVLLAQVDTVKARIDAIPNLLKRFRQSVLTSAVGGRLTEDWRANNTSVDVREDIDNILIDRGFSSKSKKESASHLTNEEYEIPNTWSWVSLDLLSAKIVDGTHHTPTYVSEGIPFISVKDIRDGSIDFSNTKYITKEEHADLCKRCHPEVGDLLITKSGTIGRTAIITTNNEFSLFVSVALIKPASKLVNMKFVNIALDKWVGSIDISSRIVGSAIKNLHLTDMKVLAVPFAPLQEQTEIVRRVEQLFAFANQLEAKVASAKSRIDHLTQSILAKAFRGELVPQDPSDEPAKVLLERIQAQRAAAPKAKAKRGRKST